MSGLVALTTRASVGVQLLTGLVGVYGLTLPLAPEDAVLRQVLGLELIVQLIEFIFYLGFIYITNLVSLTQARYFDWFLSTPLMLFTTALYFKYRKGAASSVTTFIEEHWQPLLKMVLLNAGMLFFGLAAEYGWIPRWVGFAAGSACLAGAFWILYDEFARGDSYSETMWGLMFAIWGAYGFAFLASPVAKNVAYNGLDIIAKNFFGLFLVYQIGQRGLLSR